MARGQGDVFKEVRLHDPEQMLDTSFDSRYAFRLSLILKPLLRNAISAVDFTPHGTVRIIPRRVFKSGKQYLSLTISNPLQLRQFPPEERMQALFRVPIASDRWHLGTFMAGVLARSLGGDVYAVFNQKRKNVQVVIEVPLLDVPDGDGYDNGGLSKV